MAPTSGQNTTARPHILCVDDEPQVLEGLTAQLRQRFEIKSASSGAAGLRTLAEDKAIMVVISGMRMQGMDGAAFLQQVRLAAPEVVRVMLAGQADLAAAIAALNEGQIFRFLTKPCHPPALRATVEAAVAQHQHTAAERAMLEQTLVGSIKLLTDVLALTSPVSFARATRIKELVIGTAEKLQVEDRWPIEAAALLSQIGWITIPEDIAEKVHCGEPLVEAEQAMLERLPALAEQLLAHIPRLELVRAIIGHQRNPTRRRETVASDPQAQTVARGAQILRAAIAFDELDRQGVGKSGALDILRGRTGQYEPAVLDALEAGAAFERSLDLMCEVLLRKVHAGMIFAEDVKLTNGTLLVARGYEVTTGFAERARNFKPGTVREPIRVILPGRRKSPS
jgi:response regulator RpfG family c-di-GMP phosphodiesterase